MYPRCTREGGTLRVCAVRARAACISHGRFAFTLPRAGRRRRRGSPSVRELYTLELELELERERERREAMRTVSRARIVRFLVRLLLMLEPYPRPRVDPLRITETFSRCILFLVPRARESSLVGKIADSFVALFIAGS